MVNAIDYSTIAISLDSYDLNHNGKLDKDEIEKFGLPSIFTENMTIANAKALAEKYNSQQKTQDPPVVNKTEQQDGHQDELSLNNQKKGLNLIA